MNGTLIKLTVDQFIRSAQNIFPNIQATVLSHQVYFSAVFRWWLCLILDIAYVLHSAFSIPHLNCVSACQSWVSKIHILIQMFRCRFSYIWHRSLFLSLFLCTQLKCIDHAHLITTTYIWLRKVVQVDRDSKDTFSQLYAAMHGSSLENSRK